MRLRGALLSIACVLSCSDDDDASGPDERLLDPEACAECHPQHYREWLGSMHAYAADDPVFIAMNARGQRETGGALGDFCVRCHAPMAVALGETTDGLNLAELPQHLKGVTCYFCHDVVAVEGTHDNPLVLAMDDVMRGKYPGAIENDFHRTDYSAFLDGDTLASAQMCGSCHDIVNGHGVALERTYQEYLASLYARPNPANPMLAGVLTCNGCHMKGTGTQPIADFPGVPSRTTRDHRFVGVDVHLTDFPDAEQFPALRDDQLAGMEEFREPAVCVGLCVRPPTSGTGTDVVVWLHNETAGHAWPSGAAQDRRAWVQLEAFSVGTPVLQSGVVAPDASIDAAAANDPMVWVFRDFAFGADGEPAAMFWEITDVESNLLRVSPEFMLDRTTWVSRTWHIDGPVDHASVQVNLRPIPFELVDELVEDGLDPAVKDRIPTHVVGATVVEWTPETAVMTEPEGMCVESASCFRVISPPVE